MIGSSEWVAIALGAATIAWVNWYFFLASRRKAAAVPGAGGAEVVIAVEGGYDPATVRGRAGEPLTLVFDRKDSSGCSEEVVFPDFGIRRFLPTGVRTRITIVPPKAGRYEFTCGMGMLRGAVVAEG